MIFNIVIDANIGAGKTTLIKNLKDSLKSNDDIVYNFFEENVSSWMEEGWLQKYYSDIPRYAASFQTKVLLSHIQQKKEITEINKNQSHKTIVNICERSAITTVNIFSNMLINDGSMDKLELGIHRQLLEMFEYGKPDLLIYLDVKPDMAYERLKKRSRTGECSISLEYLIKLNDMYIQELDSLAKKILVIDGNNNESYVLEKCLEVI